MVIAAIIVGFVLIALGALVVTMRRDELVAKGLPSGISWFSRRRAVAATLEVATAQTSAPAPVIPVRPREEASFFERVINPFAGAAGSLIGRISPPGYVESIMRRQTIAGKGRRIDCDRFLVGRIATIALIPVAFIAIELVPLARLYRLLAFLLATVLLLLGPEAALNRKARERQEEIRRELPGLVDLLMISVEAGLGFDQALTRAVASTSGPLSLEFGRFLGEVRIGADRTASLEALDSRTDVPELRSLLMALIQAETFGVSIANILKAQAQDIRIAQRQHVQELAQKAPTKMLFPLVFCVLPALFIVIIGPAVIEIYRDFTKYF